MQIPLRKTFTKEQLKKHGPSQKAEEFRTINHVYETPFVYDNLKVCNFYGNPGSKGLEFKADDGFITITEEKPILAITVVGSGCTRGGYNMVEWWEEGEGIDEMKDQLVKRQRIEHLNGMHPSVWINMLRDSPGFQKRLYMGKPMNQANISDNAYTDNINMIKHNTFNYYEPYEISLYENTAYFRIGRKDHYTHKVTIRSGCKGVEDPGTDIERYPADYCIRLIEVTLMDIQGK